MLTILKGKLDRILSKRPVEATSLNDSENRAIDAILAQAELSVEDVFELRHQYPILSKKLISWIDLRYESVLSYIKDKTNAQKILAELMKSSNGATTLLVWLAQNSSKMGILEVVMGMMSFLADECAASDEQQKKRDISSILFQTQPDTSKGILSLLFIFAQKNRIAQEKVKSIINTVIEALDTEDKTRMIHGYTIKKDQGVPRKVGSLKTLYDELYTGKKIRNGIWRCIKEHETKYPLKPKLNGIKFVTEELQQKVISNTFHPKSENTTITLQRDIRSRMIRVNPNNPKKSEPINNTQNVDQMLLKDLERYERTEQFKDQLPPQQWSVQQMQEQRIRVKAKLDSSMTLPNSNVSENLQGQLRARLMRIDAQLIRPLHALQQHYELEYLRIECEKLMLVNKREMLSNQQKPMHEIQAVDDEIKTLEVCQHTLSTFIRSIHTDVLELFENVKDTQPVWFINIMENNKKPESVINAILGASQNSNTPQGQLLLLQARLQIQQNQELQLEQQLKQLKPQIENQPGINSDIEENHAVVQSLLFLRHSTNYLDAPNASDNNNPQSDNRANRPSLKRTFSNND